MEYKYCRIGPNVFRVPYNKEDNILDYFHIEVVHWDSKTSFHFERNDICYWALDHVEIEELEMHDDIDELLSEEDYPEYWATRTILKLAKKLDAKSNED